MQISGLQEDVGISEKKRELFTSVAIPLLLSIFNLDDLQHNNVFNFARAKFKYSKGNAKHSSRYSIIDQEGKLGRVKLQSQWNSLPEHLMTDGKAVMCNICIGLHHQSVSWFKTLTISSSYPKKLLDKVG
ncbi:hypothetical protein C8J56DRAFT_892243 [Mycena floridula]|nr:hypothetical protein C8J56DRAFT_892243 [Mycena floridula]